MRILLLSDIHSNLEALNAVLEAAPSCDAVWNLGDVVGYGADPNQVINRVRRLGTIFIRGNHDKACCGLGSIENFNPIAARAVSWTRDALTPENAEWLRQLPAGPIMPEGSHVSCSHGSPLDEDEYLISMEDARPALAEAPARINFFGHTHVQGGFATNGEDWFRIAPQFALEGADSYELPLRENARYLINPGSIGQPRDRDWRAAFALYEIESEALQRVLFYRVPYDLERAQEKILAAGLPDRLATRLREGR